ncbi:MAG: hypothetical protein R3F39_17890 [Myxococcota bacterium]
MQCPRCGFDQPASEECIACGVVISKYLSTVDELADIAVSTPFDDDPFAALGNPEALLDGDSAAPFQLASTTGRGSYAEPPPSFPPPDDDPFASQPIHDLDAPAMPGTPSRPVSRVGGVPAHRISALDFDSGPPVYIGGVASVLRIIAAFVCLGLAIIMVMNGEGLRSAWPYLVMVLYGAGALWGLLTARHDISVRQFGIEMAVLAVITIGLRLASPETFAVETHGPAVKASVATRVPDTALGRFTTTALDFLESTGEVLKLQAPVSKERWSDLSKSLDFGAVKLGYDSLDTEERARVFDVWKRLADFGPIVASMLERYMVTDSNGDVRLEIPEVERRAVGGELPDAISRLHRVQERISEVVEAGGGAKP